MSERAGLHKAEAGGAPIIATVYALLNTKAVDRALQTQADKLCGLVQGVDVLPALMQEVTAPS